MSVEALLAETPPERRGTLLPPLGRETDRRETKRRILEGIEDPESLATTGLREWLAVEEDPEIREMLEHRIREIEPD